MEPSNIAAVIYDPVVEGQDHAPFNYSLAASAAIAFKPLSIVFFAGPSHLDYLARTTDLFAHHNVIPVKVTNPPRRVRDSLRIVWELPNVLRAMRLANRAKHRFLVVANGTTSTLLTMSFARLVARIGGFCVPTSVVLHAVLAELWGWRSRNPLRRCFDTKSALRLLSLTNIRLWVLEDGIRRELAAKMPRMTRQLHVFPHPIPDEEFVEEAASLSSPIRFGFLGRAMRAKNFDMFLKIASDVRRAVGDRAEFHAIGARVEAFAPELLANLATQPADALLERDIYLSLVRNLHYVMLLNGGIYRYIASGAALDAIAALRPVIGLDKPANGDLLRNHGDIGFLCEEPSEIVRLAVTLALEPNPNRYAVQVNNLARLRQSRSASRLAERLRALVDGGS